MDGNLKLFIGFSDVGERVDRLSSKALLPFNTCRHVCTYTYAIDAYYYISPFQLNPKAKNYSINQKPVLKLTSTCKYVKINAKS